MNVTNAIQKRDMSLNLKISPDYFQNFPIMAEIFGPDWEFGPKISATPPTKDGVAEIFGHSVLGHIFKEIFLIFMATT